MKNIAILLTVILLATSLSYATATVTDATSSPLQASADIPTWYPGDTWTYTIDPLYASNINGTFSGTVTNFQQTVVAVHDDTYDLTVSADLSGTFTGSSISGDISGTITGTSTTRRCDLAQGPTILASSGTITPNFPPIPIPYTADLTISSTPLLELFDFPLIVGDHWQIQCQSTTQGNIDIFGILQQSLDGNQTVDEEVSCLQQATITVPAGSFNCYEIARTTTDGWYSQDVGNLVKSTVDQSDENGTVNAVLTLQSYNRATQPLSVSEDLSPAMTSPGAAVTVSGLCFASGSPVAVATVTISIPVSGDSWATTTDANGHYTLTFTTPKILDDTPSGRETGSSGVIVTCQKDSLNGYCVKTLTTLFNTPPLAPTINGPQVGKTGEKYTCSLTSTDAEGDQLMYFVDWGDNKTQWVGPGASGASLTASHTYATKGTYLIKAKATDTFGAESEWGSLQVKMPLSLAYRPWQMFLERHPHAFPLLRLLLEQ